MTKTFTLLFDVILIVINSAMRYNVTMSNLKITDQMLLRYLNSAEYSDDYIPQGNEWSGVTSQDYDDQYEVDDEGSLVASEE